MTELRFWLQLSLLTLICLPAICTANPTIEEIIVVGARLPRPATDVAATVDVIPRADLVSTLVVDLADIASQTPGLSLVTADNRFGDTEIAINGLKGNRVVTLIDGIPINSQFDIGAFAHAGQDYVVTDAVQRIELLRGPASTLFGSDALGGVFAIVTRDADNFFTPRSLQEAQANPRQLTGGLSTTRRGSDDSTTTTAWAAGRSTATDWVLHLSHGTGHGRDGWDPLDRKRNSAMFKSGHTTSAGNRVSVNFQHFSEAVDSDAVAVLGYGRRFRNTDQLLGDDTRERNALGVLWDFAGDFPLASAGRLNAFVVRTELQQFTAESRSAIDTSITRDFRMEHGSAGLVFDADVNFGDNVLGWGFSVVESSIEEIRDGTQTIVSTGVTSHTLLGEVLPTRDFPQTALTERALFVQHEARFGDLLLLPAIRFEDYSLDSRPDTLFRAGATAPVDVKDTAVVPKLGAIYQLNPDLQAYAQYARGFRAPPFDDVNVGLEIPRFNYRGLSNPDLQAETSDGIELGLRLTHNQVSATLALYQANYDNFIESRVNIGTDPDTGTTLFQSRNVEKARVIGAVANASVDLGALSLSAVATWISGENRTTGQYLNTVEPTEFAFKARWQATDRWSLAAHTRVVEGVRRYDRQSQATFIPPGYATLNLYAGFEHSRQLRIDLAIHNVTNRRYWQWLSVAGRAGSDPLIPQLAAPGRYASAAVRLSI